MICWIVLCSFLYLNICFPYFFQLPEQLPPSSCARHMGASRPPCFDWNSRPKTSFASDRLGPLFLPQVPQVPGWGKPKDFWLGHFPFLYHLVKVNLVLGFSQLETTTYIVFFNRACSNCHAGSPKGNHQQPRSWELVDYLSLGSRLRGVVQ